MANRSQPNNVEVIKHFRETTLGSTLTASLDELKVELDAGSSSSSQMSVSDENFRTLKEKVMRAFDEEMSHKLSTMAKNKILVTGDLVTYRHCDNVWQMVLDNVEMKGSEDRMEVDRLKIIACEDKNQVSRPKGRGNRD